MFVSKGAVKRIQTKRKNAFYNNYIIPLLAEASNLEINKEELLDMIKREEEK
jgi:GntR family transcriptional regulator